MRITDFFDRGWRLNRNGAAFVMDERTYSYTQAGELSCRIAQALSANGFAAGTKVAVLSPNDPLGMICVLGLWRAGCTWVPLKADIPTAESIDLLSRFDCELILFHSSQREAAQQMAAVTPSVRETICFDVGLEPWLAGHPATDPEPPHQPDEVIAIMATGGTTGPSKGVMITHRSMSAALTHMLLAFHYPENTPIVNLAAAPLTHTAGFLAMPALTRGGTVVLIPRATPDGVVDAIERHHVTEVFLPPTVIYRMLELDDIRQRDLSSLRYLLYGAAPISVAKLRRAIQVFGPVMMGGYGQTEAFGSIAYLRPEEHFEDGEIASDRRLSSVGRPFPLLRVGIFEGGRELTAGESGEICVRGDNVMAGYYGDAAATASTVVDGWLLTGDVGHVDDDGYLYITDRKKDLIITGGYNVYPAEVENVVLGHPAVQDCAVVGAPDADWGEAVTAVVELVPGQDVTADELIAMCKAKLGSVRTPKAVDVVDSLPRSSVGKVLRREVRARYWAALEQKI
ncbi:class I adenylate-forming enzyme family protein [Mycolicibacterium stellerae]|uniref:class I adenylate-forming enzyme family protein n=1 Tax=Mycolicibacterium stellerae TaxID=2358193 RepID=UPI000F0B7020|nr:AMP-binding protein [Mycolicibacterium stellerae]